MYKDLDSIVRDYLHKHRFTTTHKYLRTMQILIEFLMKFSQGTPYMVKEDVFKVDEKYAIQLPPNFVNLDFIAWMSGDRLIKFERDRTINTNFSYCEDVGAATPNQAYNIFAAWPFNRAIISQNQLSFQELGRGHNGSGYFKINWPAKEIQFSTDSKISGGVFMSFRTNGFNPTSRTTIPEFAAILADRYIHWQMAVNDRKMGEAHPETEARRRSYLREYDDMLANGETITYESIMGARARAFDVNRILM